MATLWPEHGKAAVKGLFQHILNDEDLIADIKRRTAKFSAMK